jgi:hypothetical protein
VPGGPPDALRRNFSITASKSQLLRETGTSLSPSSESMRSITSTGNRTVTGTRSADERCFDDALLALRFIVTSH